MTITPVVVAHPKRAARAKALSQQLNLATIVMDDEGLGDWANHARALSWAAQQGTSHVLCIEDDALPVPNLLKEAARAVQAAPGAPISLYVGTGRPRALGVQQAIARADEIDSRWLVADSLCWGVAFILPAADVLPMLAWCRGRREPTDQRIGAWYRSQGRSVLYTWPSLVDHADDEPVIPAKSREYDDAHRGERKAHRVGVVDEYRGMPVRIERSV